MGWSTPPLQSWKCGTVTCRARWRGAFPASATEGPEQGEVRLSSGATERDHTAHHPPHTLGRENSEIGRGGLVHGRMGGHLAPHVPTLGARPHQAPPDVPFRLSHFCLSKSYVSTLSSKTVTPCALLQGPDQTPPPREPPQAPRQKEHFPVLRGWGGDRLTWRLRALESPDSGCKPQLCHSLSVWLPCASCPPLFICND